MRFIGEEGDEGRNFFNFHCWCSRPLAKWIELYPVMHCFLEISLPPKCVDSQDVARS